MLYMFRPFRAKKIVLFSCQFVDKKRGAIMRLSLYVDKVRCLILKQRICLS